MPVINFSKEIPEFIKNDGTNIEFTDAQYKQGNKSLKWQYTDGDYIQFNTEIGYGPLYDSDINADKYAFSMYIFGISGDGNLTVEFLKQGDVVQSFEVNLGFTGWRHIGASFDRDMKGIPQYDMDALRITAHGSGEILLNELITANRVSCGYLHTSYQMPDMVKNTACVTKAAITNTRVFKKEFSQINISRDELQTIKTRFKRYLLAEFDRGISQDELIKSADSLEIKEGKYGLIGKHVEHGVQRTYVVGTEFASEKCISLRFVTDLMSDLAVTYNKTGNKDLADRYILILRYLILQGFDEGSTMGSHDLLDYSLRPMYRSVMLMVDEIQKAGLSDTVFRAMRWFTHMDTCGYLQKTHIGYASADDMNNLSQSMFIVAIMAVDAGMKENYLKAVAEWLDFNLHHTVGLTDMLKEDGCIYHHIGHYLAYGIGALQGITPMLYCLGGTSFDVGEIARQNVKKVLLAIRFQCCGTDYPIVFTARHPLGTMGISTEIYKYFALYELQKNDIEMANVYLRLKGTPTDELDREIVASGAVAESSPEGNWNFPMACANVHRRDDWILIAKGFSRYLWGSESYLPSNRYGRYRSYGNIELLTKSNLKDSGFSHDGYDWNRFAGTTSIYTPFEELKTRVYSVDDYSGFEEMLLSDQRFAGGCSLDGNGMFSMILTEHPKYNGTFKAYKSVFMLDDFILAIGSNITNVSPYETETTLFQNSVQEGDSPVRVEGNKVWDNKGNVYYLAEGSELYTNTGRQVTPGSTGEGIGEGDFAVGVLKHGISPKDASYEYAIGVNGAAKKDYTVIRCDNVAHVVKIENITYMAIFEPQNFDLVKVDIPVLLMLEEKQCGVKVAICNPDLMLYDEDISQYDENGIQREVSVYSRQWINNPVGGQYANLKIKEKEFKLYLKGGAESYLEI